MKEAVRRLCRRAPPRRSPQTPSTCAASPSSLPDSTQGTWPLSTSTANPSQTSPRPDEASTSCTSPHPTPSEPAPPSSPPPASTPASTTTTPSRDKRPRLQTSSMPYPTETLSSPQSCARQSAEDSEPGSKSQRRSKRSEPTRSPSSVSKNATHTHSSAKKEQQTPPVASSPKPQEDSSQRPQQPTACTEERAEHARQPSHAQPEGKNMT
mmetsp:Transcript_10865/g.35720  ORF Transcript_10865/g.35720 Transcript_10865/m.35720 type:complete len:210 (-) Transcript_10865:6-635(-)